MEQVIEKKAEIANKVGNIVDRAKGLVIANDEHYQAAAEFFKQIKAVRREIDDTFDPPIKAAHNAHKAAIAAKNKHDAPLGQAEGIIKQKVAAYNQKKKEEAEAEERRRIEQARQKERERQEAERKAEEQRRLEEAAKLEAEGFKEEAEAIIEQPVHVPEKPIEFEPVKTAAPKVEGVSFRKNWKWRKAENFDITKVPAQYLMLNESAIGQVVRALKENANIPQIVVYSEQSTVGR